LRRAGADVRVTVTGHDAAEPRGIVQVRAGVDARPLEIAPSEVPSLIDELPALAAAGALRGGMRVSGAGELRVKESDRIAALVAGLRALGGDAEEREDGLVVRPARLAGGDADAAGDHRLAMALAIAALGAAGPSRILGADAAAVSYPGFFEALESLRV
jgi:3-phosphoshikimate 1-carboxyvinyltransferase